MCCQQESGNWGIYNVWICITCASYKNVFWSLLTFKNILQDLVWSDVLESAIDMHLSNVDKQITEF